MLNKATNTKNEINYDKITNDINEIQKLISNKYLNINGHINKKNAIFCRWLKA